MIYCSIIAAAENLTGGGGGLTCVGVSKRTNNCPVPRPHIDSSPIPPTLCSTMRSPCAMHRGLDRRSMHRLYNYWTSSPFLHSTVKLSIIVSAMYVDVATNDDKLPLTRHFETGPSGAAPPLPCSYSIHSHTAQYGGQHDRAPRVSRGRSTKVGH